MQTRAPRAPTRKKSVGLIEKFFARRPVQELVDEAYHPDRQLNKVLSAFDLVAFGIGCIIGSGIFALTGTAAAGQTGVVRNWLSTPVINFILGSPIGREGAGPAIVISFLIAGFACALALPIVGIVSCLILMLSLPVITWIRFIAWMIIGIVIYLGYGLKQDSRSTA